MIHFPATDMCSVAHRDAYLQSFLHRDISPGNILITEDPRFDSGMLIDWDLYKAKDDAEVGVRQNSLTVRGVLPNDTNTL
jgi:serine/threonine protein kinase